MVHVSSFAPHRRGEKSELIKKEKRESEFHIVLLCHWATQLLKIKDQYEYAWLNSTDTIESAKFAMKEAELAIQALDFGEDTRSISSCTKKR